MPANYLTGKQASVTIGGTAFRFRKWSLEMKAGVLNVTNFLSAGYREVAGGIIEADLTLEGPYDAGNMPFQIGQAYQFVLGYGPAVSITVTAMVNGISPDIDVDKEEVIKITAAVNGTFTAAIS